MIVGVVVVVVVQCSAVELDCFSGQAIWVFGQFPGGSHFQFTHRSFPLGRGGPSVPG